MLKTYSADFVFQYSLKDDNIFIQPFLKSRSISKLAIEQQRFPRMVLYKKNISIKVEDILCDAQGIYQIIAISQKSNLIFKKSKFNMPEEQISELNNSCFFGANSKQQRPICNYCQQDKEFQPLVQACFCKKYHLKCFQKQMIGNISQ